MVHSIYLEIEENPNCEYMPLQVYEALEESVPIEKVVMEVPGRPHGVYHVAGWNSEGATTAYYVPISDSGQGVAHLVYGGDCGLRLKFTNSNSSWDLLDETQWGEPYIIFTEKSSILI